MIAVHKRRRGAAMVETAIVLSTLLILLLGMFDLSLGVLRHNFLSDSARRLAREAVVHGRLAEADKTAWGTSTYVGTAADVSEIGDMVRPLLLTMNPEDVQVRVDWLSGSNEPGALVRVTITYTHAPMTSFVLGGADVELRAVSTMQIAH